MKVTVNGRAIKNRQDIYDALNCAGQYANIEYHEMNERQVSAFHSDCKNDVHRFTDVDGNTDTFTSYTVKIDDEEQLDGFYLTIDYFREIAVEKICQCLSSDGFDLIPTTNADGIKIDYEKCDGIYQHMKNRYMHEAKSGTAKGVYLWTGSAREIQANLYLRQLHGDITIEEMKYIFGIICNCALNFCHGDFWRA